MSDLPGQAHSRFVRRMFGRIAPQYDRLNRWMTFGRDRVWRTELVRRLALPAAPHVLDLGAGTGDLALETLRQRPAARVLAVDFTPEMLRLGRLRPGGERVTWVVADAARLPVPQAAFDAVISGFLLRNVPDLAGVLAEERRVLRPGGKIASLDTTPPPASWLRPWISFHLHTVIPCLGSIFAADREAYTYLPDSTERFLDAESLAKRMAETGFSKVSFVRRMFGTIALHWGIRPREPHA